MLMVDYHFNNCVDKTIIIIILLSSFCLSICIFFFFTSTVVPQILPFSFGEEVVNAGDMTAVQCTVVKGDSPISIQWLFNETEISPDDGIMISRAGSRLSSMSIESVRAEHSGAYTCVARNAAGSVNHTAYLRVNGMSFIFNCDTHVKCK